MARLINKMFMNLNTYLLNGNHLKMIDRGEKKDSCAIILINLSMGLSSVDR
jgi:hypothetical protein